MTAADCNTLINIMSSYSHLYSQQTTHSHPATINCYSHPLTHNKRLTHCRANSFTHNHPGRVAALHAAVVMWRCRQSRKVHTIKLKVTTPTPHTGTAAIRARHLLDKNSAGYPYPVAMMPPMENPISILELTCEESIRK